MSQPEIKHPDCHPLIVDDDPDFTLLLWRTLEKVGVPSSQIRSCSDGEEAILLLSKVEWIPSFVLLDLNMPRRSGLEVLEWMRSIPPPVAELPVFMLTASSDPDHVARAFQFGVGSYFIKTLGIHDLGDVLEGILAYWKSRDRTSLIQGSLAPQYR